MTLPRRIRDENGNLPDPAGMYGLQRIRDAAQIRQTAEDEYNASLDVLARECVEAAKAGVGLTYIAEAAGVSRMTVHRWIKQVGD